MSRRREGVNGCQYTILRDNVLTPPTLLLAPPQSLTPPPFLPCPSSLQLLGLTLLQKGTKPTEITPLTSFKMKKPGQLKLTMMGTPESSIFVDPSDMDVLPDVVDDFDSEWNAGTEKWFESIRNDVKLREYIDKTDVHFINPLRNNREGGRYPLCVLDLDHTLMDFSRRVVAERGEEGVGMVKRPFMDEFLISVYRDYDIVGEIRSEQQRRRQALTLPIDAVLLTPLS